MTKLTCVESTANFVLFDLLYLYGIPRCNHFIKFSLSVTFVMILQLCFFPLCSFVLFYCRCLFLDFDFFLSPLLNTDFV